MGSINAPAGRSKLALLTDNENNPAPVHMILRMDAGFGTDANWENQFLHNCPYPLTMALERFHTPDGLKHSTLIVYRDDGRQKTLSEWFHFYNGRQLIEAGIVVNPSRESERHSPKHPITNEKKLVLFSFVFLILFS